MSKKNHVPVKKKKIPRIAVVSVIAVLAVIAIVARASIKGSAGKLEKITVVSRLVGKPAPDFGLANPAGKIVTLKDLRANGRPVVLFLNGGGGCGTCLAQIMKLNSSRVFTDGSVGVASIVSAHSDPASAWRAFIEKNPEFKKTEVLIDDDNSVVQAYGVLSLPSALGHGGGHMPGHTYVIIDKQGNVRLVADDETMADHTAELEEYIKKL